ncbi:MAG TPA: lipase maturation factor family protein [Gemmatimonadaceae bacterium]|nr:lipase maturation factor family protein [Gemmatimonadaceae bacterium]
MITASALFGGGATSEYWLTRLLLQRALAGVYFIAFLVAVNQFRPLLGAHGLTPVPFFVQNTRFWQSPSVFYLHYSDAFASVVAWAGLVLATLAIAGVSERFGTPVSMAVWTCMWIAYLSIVNVGQAWYSFGWESLLLEAGFLAIFLGARGTATPVIVIWMYRWVLFRLMFGAGMIKLRGDPCWRDLTCLVYHYQSQPIPNLFSWYMHRSPVWLSKLGVLFNHLAEVIAPFGYLVPVASVRRAAGIITIVFQGSIIVSGNLSWLNWLTIVIAISCFDDAFLGRIIPVKAGALAPLAAPHQIAIGLLSAMVVLLSIRPAINLLSRRQMMNASFEPLHLVNTYGAFGSVSRQRFEIVLEGTADSVPTASSVWKEYQFKGKPGDVHRMPPFLAPYHRRLDWLMWFIPLDPGYADGWYPALVARLLQNDAATLSLMASNPFPDAPPKWIRARAYEYEFTTADEKKSTGDWWKRTRTGDFMGPISLDTPGFVRQLEEQGWVR